VGTRPYFFKFVACGRWIYAMVQTKGSLWGAAGQCCATFAKDFNYAFYAGNGHILRRIAPGTKDYSDLIG
jgi:hypothetical protein